MNLDYSPSTPAYEPNGPDYRRLRVVEVIPEEAMEILQRVVGGAPPYGWMGCERAGPGIHALDAGIHGYLSKAAPNYELIRAIRQVRAGRRAIPGPVASKVAEHLIEEALTPREIQVLQLVARGNRNKQVAAQLSIADETVRMHMKNILGKLAANDRTHAVTIAVTRGVIRLWEAM